MPNSFSTTIKKIAEQEDFKLFAQGMPQGLLALDENGVISFANQAAQKICYFPAKKEIVTITPFAPYKEFIDPSNSAIIEVIEDTLTHKKNFYRQIQQKNKIFTIESKCIVREPNTLIGCVVSFMNITELSTKEKQQELLYQVSSALSGVNTLEPLLKTAIIQLKKTMRITDANIMLFDPKSQKLKLRVGTNRMPPGHTPREFELGEGVAGRAAQERKPYSVPDVLESPEFIHPNKSDQGALLVVPLIVHDKLMGVINVRDDTPRYFKESEVQFLTIVANEIAIAIDNSILYEKLTQKILLLSKLFPYSSLSVTKSLDTHIQRFVRTVPDLLDVDGSGLYMYNAATHTLSMKYYSEFATRLPNQLSLQDSLISKSVLQEQQTLIINDPDSFLSRQEAKRFGITNFMACPIIVNDKAIGILTAFNKWDGAFTEGDKNLLSIIAQRIGIKIENAQLIRRVQSEKEMLGKIIENTSEGVSVLDRRKKIVIWNEYLEELTGLKSEDVIGKPGYTVFYSMLGLKKLTRYLYSAHNPTPHQNPNVSEEHVKLANGEKIWISSITSDILDHNKKVENTIIVMRNVSRDKELLQAKDEFVSLTTHELRTPITAVKGYISMILKGDAGPVTEQQKTYFSKASLATERLAGLVEELLEVFRIDEDRIQFDLQDFNINSIIEESIEELSEKAKTRGISVRYEAGVPHTVYADPQKTKQIIQNLLDNAIKYNRERGQITIRLEKQEHTILIIVKDTGIGIPAKYIRTIFDRFIRVPNARSIKVGGAGLGLYIVKRLVERQGGTIKVSSQPGKGTTFSFTLPSTAITSPLAIKERSTDV